MATSFAPTPKKTLGSAGSRAVKFQKTSLEFDLAGSVTKQSVTAPRDRRSLRQRPRLLYYIRRAYMSWGPFGWLGTYAKRRYSSTSEQKYRDPVWVTSVSNFKDQNGTGTTRLCTQKLELTSRGQFLSVWPSTPRYLSRSHTIFRVTINYSPPPTYRPLF
jgi:hypothetical protein